jgi:quinohemoprotein ethanol dehydrogenase
MRMKTAAMAVTAFALLVGAEAFSSNAKPDVDTRLLAGEHDAANWASYGRTYSENHYSPLSEISANNVGRLGLAWSADLEVLQRADSQPLAVDGIVYVAAGLSIVQAFNATNGRRLWRYDAQVAKVAGVKLRGSWGIRGLALWKGRVLVATPDGRLLALDASTGKLLWSTQALDRKMDALGGGTITGAPRVFDDRVLIGSAGGDWWSRGALSCFDARTGKLLWRFYTVPGNPTEGFESKAMEMAARTWSGEWWKYGGGGTVWNAITYDPDFNRIYIGTGNGDPQNWKIRNPKGGDNLFLDSIVALDANTGAYVWHYQLNPNDAWDYDATTDMVLEDLTLDGKTRKVLMQAAKNGFFYVLDRETGTVISAEKFERVSWAERIDLKSGRPVENPGIRYEQGPVLVWPGKLGAHSWQPMSYSPQTRLVYIPTGHSAGIYSSEGIDPATWVLNPNSWNSGMSTQAPPPDLKVPVEEFKGHLQAWDPIRQRAVWNVEMPSVSSGGPMATAGGLVFQGNADGTFDAYDASTGTKLWSFNARVAVLGAPISYSVGGRQYITVLSGPPSGTTATPDIAKFGWQYRDHPRRILTFTLDAKSELPATTPPRLGKPLLDNRFEANPGVAARGAALYGINCLTCHGVAAVAAGTAPDLRESAIPLDRDTYRQFVRAGAESQGMPQFSEMSDDELEAIRQYIRMRAQGAKPTGAVGQPH